MKRIFLAMCLILSSSCIIAMDQSFGEDADIKKKMQRAEKLVNEAVVFFKSNSLGAAMRAFEKDARWRDGEFSMFVFGIDGTCYLFGEELLPLWEDFTDIEKIREIHGALERPFIQDMAQAGAKGGWVSYDWNYSTNHSFVRTVVKNGIRYIIGTGFYPQSPRFAILQLVKRAVQYGKDNGAEALFNFINNPIGQFAKGHAYLSAYDMEGYAYAHGRNLAIVGQNRLDWKDSSGRMRNRIMIDMIKDVGHGWFEYDDHGIAKESYAESFKDPKSGKQYIISGGYYPHLTDDTITSFVQRAINHLKSEGAAIALRDFTSSAGGFMQGPLRLVVFDPQGKVLADAQSRVFTGQNLMDARDPEGKYMIREIINTALEQKRGWVTYVDKRDYKTVYVELVEIPDGKYIIGAGFWPSSKDHTTRALNKKAVTYLENHSVVEAMRMFTGTSSNFLRGDLFVSVYTVEGICMAHGLDRDRIWFDETEDLDKKGYPIIEQVIDTAQRGGGWVEFIKHGQPYRVYTKLVEKEVSQVEQESVLLEKEQLIQTDKRVTRKPMPKSQKKKTPYVVTVGYFK